MALEILSKKYMDTVNLNDEIIQQIKTVYDPEISVNIYDLGLIYDIRHADDVVEIDMTLTSAFCPAAETIPNEVKSAVSRIPSIKEVTVNIVWEPAWGRDMISDEAKLELGIY